ncbi:MAG: prolipoprotein diacylglyceryl transferase [Candidatus Dadabacteria bacterium]|jgi:phosphatidylglycerol:prolipoprotein diacylglycerol transferase
MYPTLFTVGDIYVSSFSVMVLIAFLVGYFVAEVELKRKGLNSNLADLLLIACVIGGLGGAKILFLYQNVGFSDFISDPVRYLASGFTFLGGFLGSLLLIWFVTQMKRVRYLTVTDAAAPALILAYAIGRIGCLLVGDDYGAPTSLPWAISFPNGSPPTFLAVHPTQIYDTISMLIFFIILWTIRKKDFPIGWITAVTLMVLGVQRFLVEFLRDTTPSFIPGLSQAQVISIILVLVGALMLYKVGQNKTKESKAY